MYEYKVKYLAVGIKYENYSETIRDPVTGEFDKDGTAWWQRELEEQLNAMAKRGWELVSIDDSLLCNDALDGYGVFKREVQNGE